MILVSLNKIVFILSVFVLLSVYASCQNLKQMHPIIEGNCMINTSKIDSIKNNYKDYPKEHLEEILELEIYQTAYGDRWSDCLESLIVTASSCLKPSTNFDYKAQNAYDFDKRTVWVEGVNGYGIGEYLEYIFTASKHYPSEITNVEIINGYVKNELSWENNSRVKKMKMFVNGVPYAILNLQDNSNLQTFSVGKIPIEYKNPIVLRFEIIDVYRGAKYDDTAITEIEFKGNGCY